MLTPHPRNVLERIFAHPHEHFYHQSLDIQFNALEKAMREGNAEHVSRSLRNIRRDDLSRFNESAVTEAKAFLNGTTASKTSRRRPDHRPTTEGQDGAGEEGETTFVKKLKGGLELFPTVASKGGGRHPPRMRVDPKSS